MKNLVDMLNESININEANSMDLNKVKNHVIKVTKWKENRLDMFELVSLIGGIIASNNDDINKALTVDIDDIKDVCRNYNIKGLLSSL